MLNIKRFALAGGVLGALYMFVMTWVVIVSGHGSDVFHLVESVYPGYHVTAVGSIVGAVYGFISGFIKLGIVAWVYNYLEKFVK
jgi:hypothetical protein